MKLLEKSLTHRILLGAIMTATTMQSGNAPAQQTSGAKQNDVTAIDILLDPDATMIQHATAANAQLLKNYPQGLHVGGRACTARLHAAAVRQNSGPPQSVRNCRQSDCQGESNQLQAYGVQVRPHR